MYAQHTVSPVPDDVAAIWASPVPNRVVLGLRARNVRLREKGRSDRSRDNKRGQRCKNKPQGIPPMFGVACSAVKFVVQGAGEEYDAPIN
jgi:hypothetical protein